MMVSIQVNGQKFEVSIREDEFLLDTLRAIGVKSVKRGCETTSCGMCSVIVDGRLVNSCAYLTLRANNKSVLTVEGLGDEGDRIAHYLTNEGVEQCGYCSPGFVMAVYQMKRDLSDFTEENVKHYLAGNLCRCSGYEGQHRGIMAYLEVK